MQTIIYRMDKQQGQLYSTGNYIQYPMIYHNGKEYEKEYVWDRYIYIYKIYIYYIYMYVCIIESLCCTAEVNTTL